MKKTFKNFSIFVLFLAIILAFSGCGRKSEPVAENNLTPALSSEEREQAPLPPLQKGEVETATSSSETVKTATSTGEIATSTDVIDTSDWKVYRNTEYGFEISYPASYENNKIYSIWDIGPEDVHLNAKEWGINKYQNTIIAIDVYTKEKKEQVLKDFKYKLSRKTKLIANNIIAENIDYFGEILFIERDEFIYFIQSSFNSTMEDIVDKEGYNEYEEILKTLKIY